MTRKLTGSPTILRVTDDYVSLHFDRDLIERLHCQRPSLDAYEGPELMTSV